MPAGLGVRDAVLLAGLSPELGPEAAALVLALRLVTTLGDGVIYLIGLPLLARRDAGEARVSPDRGQ